MARAERIHAVAVALSDAAADAILGMIAHGAAAVSARRAATRQPGGRDLLARIEAATQIPTAIMESPRGFNDATLGAFAMRSAAPI